jgi:serine/threonine-protein kinase
MFAACPDEDVIALFLAGSLDAPQDRALRDHVNTCDGCRSVLADAVRSSRAAADDLPAERTLLGKYVLEAALGSGGMGRVYRARQIALDRTVAIKLLHDWLAREPSIVRRFEREARAGAALRSRHVAQILEIERTSSGTPFIVMEYLEGTDLGALLRRERTLPLRETVRFVLEACEAVAEAHARRFVHRDLKPENLFLVHDGSPAGTVKVIDFGLAKALPGATIMRDGDSVTTAFIGSPHYMAPEQFLSHLTVDNRTDVWGMGVTLYTLLSGQPPFVAATLAMLRKRVLEHEPPRLTELRAGTPPALAEAIARAIKKNPAERWPTIEAFASALSSVYAQLPEVPSSIRLDSDTIRMTHAEDTEVDPPTAQRRRQGG